MQDQKLCSIRLFFHRRIRYLRLNIDSHRAYRQFRKYGEALTNQNPVVHEIYYVEETIN
jgi:hypothetical protein